MSDLEISKSQFKPFGHDLPDEPPSVQVNDTYINSAFTHNADEQDTANTNIEQLFEEDIKADQERQLAELEKKEQEFEEKQKKAEMDLFIRNYNKGLN